MALHELLILDVRTIIGALFWGNTFAAFIYLIYYLTNLKNTVSLLIRYNIFAKLFQGASFFFMFFRGDLPNILSVNTGNTMLFIGFFYEALAMYEICRQLTPMKKRILQITLFFCITSFNLIEFILKESSVRIAYASFCVFIIMLIPSVSLIFAKYVNLFIRILGVLYCAFLTLLIPRMYTTLATPTASLFTNNFVQCLTFISLLVIMILGLTSCFILTSEYSSKSESLLQTTDFLTKLDNRIEFHKHANTIIEEHIQKQKSITMIYFYLRHFKQINESYGQAVGDTTLIQFAQIIKNAAKEGCTCCRYGSKQFILLFPNSTLQQAKEMAENILQACEEVQYSALPEFRLQVCATIVHGTPNQQNKLEQFVTKAEKALLQQKQNETEILREVIVGE